MEYLIIAFSFTAICCIMLLAFFYNKNPKLHPIEQIAKDFAIKAHKAVYHKYDNKPYSYHLQMVRDFASKYRHHIPLASRSVVYSGCWIHDSVEDARQTYNDIAKALGTEIAEIAYALTNDKGRTRAERAGDNYYKGINETKFAGFVKICDRLANIKHSRDSQSRMLDKYRKEHEHFKQKLYFEPYSDMFDEMEELLKERLTSDQ